MKKKLAIAGSVLLLGWILLLAGPAPAAENKIVFITIGTGGSTGVYYPTGNAIAKIVNNKTEVYGIRATVEATDGSVFNVNSVMSGDLEFGVVQSDRQYQAINGLAEWKSKGPQKGLRSLFSIHPETVTLIAADDAGIHTISDLKSKRVNIGNLGSGQRQNALDALKTAGIDPETDIKAEHVKAPESPVLLQDGRIDAFFYTVGHPNDAIRAATSGDRKVKFIPIPEVGALLKAFPYYTNSAVPIEHYPDALNMTDVGSFGVKATLVTSDKTPAAVVYAITKEVFDNLAQFKEMHPAFASLTKRGMLEGLSAPMHPGALKYFKEAGLK